MAGSYELRPPLDLPLYRFARGRTEITAPVKLAKLQRQMKSPSRGSWPPIR